jgi:serine protease
LKARDQEPASSNTQTLWQRFHGDSSSIVAVVDTGILAGHPSLQGHVLPGFDMVADPFIANDGQALGSGSDRDSDASDPGNGVTFANTLTNPECGNPKNSTWHGTFVSALIAGNPMQAEQVFPINWHGQILPVRALGRCGGFTSDLADAIRWAAGLPVPNTPINTTPARVINLSLGATGGCSSNIEGAAVSAALAQGAVVIAAAGNAGGALDSPSNCPGAIAVGALDQEGLKADYSNHGSRITLMAPGGDAAFPMWSAGNSGTQAPGNNTYTSKTGTSFAAPLVAATASLMISLNPALTPADIIRILTQTSRPFISRAASPACSVSLNSTACNCNTSDCGSGMLDTAAAVNAARPDQVLANLLGPSRVAPGEMAVFDASTSFNPTGGALTYEWLVRGFTGAQAPIINRPTAANTEVSFPGSSGAYQLSLTVSNGSQSHSILKNVVISESSAATADVLGALQNVVVASLISPSASSNDTTAGPAAGSSDAGGSGSAVTPSAGGGGGGQLPAGALLCLLTGLIGLRMSRAGDRNS